MEILFYLKNFYPIIKKVFHEYRFELLVTEMLNLTELNQIFGN
jgi:hypothetical protein